MTAILEMRGVSKSFSGVQALRDVNFTVEAGQIHALVGENGAGKSTLMKVLSGVYPHGDYEGSIIFDGEERRFRDVNDSEALGIIIIHQELALIPLMSIAENIFLSHPPSRLGVIDRDTVYRRTQELLAQVGLTEMPDTLVTDLGVGKQQLVEIAKALSKRVRLLILDEPTASLNENDSAALLDRLLAFRAQGIASILISHKLSEVARVGDRISGRVWLDGREVNLSDVAAAIHAGLAYVTEDRKQLGLILDSDVRKNITLASLGRVARQGMIDDMSELRVASDYRNRMRIRCSDVYQETGQLSGGNQQKVVLSKWLMTDPKVLILDEPTRGIDVGAKYEIYCIINELAEAGKGVVMISSEMPELLGVCDRICVMNDGAFVGEFPAAEATQERKIGRASCRERADMSVVG